MHLHTILVCVLCTPIRCLTLVHSAAVVRQPGNGYPMTLQHVLILQQFAFLFRQRQRHKVHADARGNACVTACAKHQRFADGNACWQIANSKKML